MGRRWRRRVPHAWVAVGLCLAPAPIAAQGSRPSQLPAALLNLEGSWEGSGTLLGRPATFTMEWAAGDGGFVHLSFANRWVDSSGAVTPVLAARATYLVRGDSAVGVWVDDRPEQLTLRAAMTDSSVVTHWIADTEQGRTEYVIQSAAVVVVRDFVVVDGASRPFAEATYRRTTDLGR